LLGPLAPTVSDPTVSEIEVNGPASVFVEREGKRERLDVSLTEKQLQGAIYRIAHAVGQEVVDSQTGKLLSPKLQCRFADGSRMSVLFPPWSVNGITFTLRKFTCAGETLPDLVKRGMLDMDTAYYLTQQVVNLKNFVVSGCTGSGKTTLANALVACIDPEERIVAIEEPPELNIKHQNVVRWAARNDCSASDLLQESLRQNPDHIIFGEFRGPEAYPFLQGMNTGHRGTISTTHANSARDTLRRFVMCCLMSPQAPSRIEVLREMVGESVDVVVHVFKNREGKRQVTEIIEVESYDQVEVVYARE
jgi:pilus assembly protein CpaF